MKFSLSAFFALSAILDVTSADPRSLRNGRDSVDNEPLVDTKRKARKLGKGESSEEYYLDEITKSCGETIPSLITAVFSYKKDYLRLFEGNTGTWTDVCCEVSALRAELGFTWTELLAGQRCGPWIDYIGRGPNFFKPFLQLGRRRNLNEDTNAEMLITVSQEIASKMDMELGLKAGELILEAIKEGNDPTAAVEAGANDEVVLASQEDFVTKVCSSGLLPEVLTPLCPPPPTTTAAPAGTTAPTKAAATNATAAGGNRHLIFPGLYEDGFALLLLFLASPWLLPACHCVYRKNDCDYNDCFHKTLIPGKVTSNREMISDIAVAGEHYWRAQLINPFTGGFPLFGSIRACNACPGEETYFDDKWGSRKLGSEEDYNGFLPVRRGGEPFEKCLGYCLMHGSYCVYGGTEEAPATGAGGE